MKLKRQLQEMRPEPSFHGLPFYGHLPFGPQSGPLSYVYSPHQQTFTRRDSSGIPFPPVPPPNLDPRNTSGGQPSAIWPMPTPYFVGYQDPRTVFMTLWRILMTNNSQFAFGNQVITKSYRNGQICCEELCFAQTFTNWVSEWESDTYVKTMCAVLVIDSARSPGSLIVIQVRIWYGSIQTTPRCLSWTHQRQLFLGKTDIKWQHLWPLCTTNNKLLCWQVIYSLYNVILRLSPTF